ncbi:hypothetical protein C5N14_23565 [Micromonospora sp. MW-13]|uniref:DUF6158 family protein n=1 Tax=unclassified Micromonospora TaxID=2617518 RepID=UPI000E43FE66|nr:MULTISPECIES: DUF6158 family protein [unclassified Micromonospora]MCX4470399.1 DUF6158 family protein [Micromonospora sp. NBC_01655]RGC66378.1 hypothetical protein C5N14_23565 [Micromonospora sp. MW-13]
MTESVRQPGGPVEASPEQRLPEWDGDHVHDMSADGELGIDPAELADEDLIREMHSLHRTRLDTLRHAADSALANHLRRTAELETEYLARHPGREVDPARLRDE